MTTAKKTRKSSFGATRKLPSGRYQARYAGPDQVRHSAPTTFQTKGDAEAALAEIRTDIARGVWRSPDVVRAEMTRRQAKALTLGEYATAWVAGRDLKPRTRTHYGWLLKAHIVPTFGDDAIAAITPAMIRTWYAAVDTGPTARSHAYALLKSVLATAVEDELITVNPCRIKGASKVKRASEINPATIDELVKITEEMPKRLQVIVPLSAWCALRFGEVTELRRRDLDLKRAVIHVRRGVVRVGGEVIVDSPKTVAGSRDVHIPPHLVPAIRKHLRDHAQIGREGLLFYGRNGGQLPHSTLLWHFNKAAEAAGRDDLTPHGLRHTGAVLAAQSGATLAELMARLGHTTSDMALRYQHASAGRDQVIAERLSKLADGK